MIATRKFQNDKYKKNRGGRSHWLLLACAHCQQPIASYQKDGPGILKRLYLDRLADLQASAGKQLICKKCKTVLGVSIIYKKESRPAYRLFAGAVGKKIIKGDKLSEK